ncbi:MAG TPA: hypothetical protein VGK78_04950 [Nocardioides sp.]|uniref:hypothetical protein n=1 Tax=Nocardioides sp. TaxID=35761 RepID=UPI002F3EE5E6
MSESAAERVSVDLTPDEARLVIASLQQFEPYWPSEMDELSRAELLAGIRAAMDHVTTSLGSPA